MRRLTELERSTEPRKALWQSATLHPQVLADSGHPLGPILRWYTAEAPALVGHHNEATDPRLGYDERVGTVTDTGIRKHRQDLASLTLNFSRWLHETARALFSPPTRLVVLRLELVEHLSRCDYASIFHGFRHELPHARKRLDWIMIPPPVDEGARVEDQHLLEFGPALHILAQRVEVVDLYTEQPRSSRVGKGLTVESAKDEAHKGRS